MVMVVVMNDLLPPPLFNVNRPFHSETHLFMVKAMCVVKGQGQMLQRSRSCSRSTPLVTFEAWSSLDIFAFRFSNSFYELISWALPVKLVVHDCHRTLLMISQHWCRYWLDRMLTQISVTIWCHKAMISSNIFYTNTSKQWFIIYLTHFCCLKSKGCVMIGSTKSTFSFWDS